MCACVCGVRALYTIMRFQTLCVCMCVLCMCVCVPESLELHARMVGSSVLSIRCGAVSVSQVFASICLLSSSVSGSISTGGSGHSLVSKTALDRPAAPLITSNRRDSLAPHNFISKGKDVLNPRLYASIRFCSLLAIACLDFFLISRKNSFLICTCPHNRASKSGIDQQQSAQEQAIVKQKANKQGLPLELFFCFVFVCLLFCFSA